jgi:hypothetical protein
MVESACTKRNESHSFIRNNNNNTLNRSKFKFRYHRHNNRNLSQHDKIFKAINKKLSYSSSHKSIKRLRYLFSLNCKTKPR